MKSKKLATLFYAIVLGAISLYIFWNGRDGRLQKSSALHSLDEHIWPIDLADILIMRKEKSIFFVDLREKEEFKARHISGALPLFEDEQQGIITEKLNDARLQDVSFVLYATRNYRIESTQARLKSLFPGKNIHYYPGGIDEWSAAGLEIEGDEI